MKLPSASLISRHDSTAIKGFLMLLILIGHCEMLTHDPESGTRLPFKEYIYTFHVYCFFILPFLYGYNYKFGRDERNKNIKDDLIRNAKRLLIPYCWFFLLSVSLFVTVGGGSFCIEGILWAFITGCERLIDTYAGFNFLWFLPSMFAVLMFKSIIYNSTKSVGVLIFMIGFFIWLLGVLFGLPIYDFYKYSPISLIQGLLFCVLGVIVANLLSNKVVVFFAPLLFVVASVFIIGFYGLYWQVALLMHFAMPILTFVTFYCFRNVLSKISLFQIIGKYSLYVYLVHMILYNVVNRLLLVLFPPSYFLGFISLVITITLSLGCAFIMDKTPQIQKYVFPK